MRKIADRYTRRIAALDRGQARYRGDVGKILTSALTDAVDQELYNISPLKLTGKMKASIQPYYLGDTVVQVGFNLNKARHARRRLNMKGTSPSGGHRLDMNPAPIIRRIADPQIKSLTCSLLRRAVDAS